MTFDQKTHKFGMAYSCNVLGGIVYPVRKSYSEPDDVMCLDLADECFQPYEFLELTRAPEHDLIPRADADMLLESLRVHVDWFKRMRLDHHEKLASHGSLQKACDNWDSLLQEPLDFTGAMEAIKNYEQKHGAGK